MQLVAYGAQDIYLTGNPMITFFKTIYRRHTNFALEMIEQSFNGKPDFGKRVSALISRNGDLISAVYFAATLPDLISGDDTTVYRWTDHVGHFLLKSVEIEIGGQLIDKHYGDWLEIWSQLTVPAGHKKGYYEMIGQDRNDSFGRPTGLQKDVHSGAVSGRLVVIPLQFWFCRNIGLALPLISLQYHEVKINVDLAKVSDLVRAQGTDLDIGDLIDAELWVDYIYIDSDERRRFLHHTHEYLIEQLQYEGGQVVLASSSRSSPSNHTIPLNFVHPVKELIWVVQPVHNYTDRDRQPSNYTAVRAPPPMEQIGDNLIDNLTASQGLNGIQKSKQFRDFINQSCIDPPGSRNPVVSAKIILNGRDRIASRLGSYFNWVQCRDRHTCIPESPGINVYSFAAHPELQQPSGSVNFSQITGASLVVNIATLQELTDNPYSEYPGLGVPNLLSTSRAQIRIYAVNYNVLRIMNGMGGVAYDV